MSVTESASAPATLEHVEMLVASDDDAATQLAPSITDAVRRGEAVYAFVDTGRWSALTREIPAAVADDVHHIDPGDRYGSPARALRMLLDTVNRERAGGTPRVHAIGEIAFSGEPSDREWIRYESAVNEVFAGVPLRAVCLYDAARMPPLIFDAARKAHHQVCGIPTGSEPSHDFDPLDAWASLPRVPLEPGQPADLEIVAITDATSARHLVGRTVDAWGFDATRRADIELVVAELIANGIVHARTPPDLLLWREHDRLVLSVRDDGPGVADPYVGFRPPWTGGLGAGLWLVAQISDAFDVTPGPNGGTTVTVSLGG